MIDNFFIYSHDVVPSAAPGQTINQDFLTTFERFIVENRVTNIVDRVQGVSGVATGFVQVGGAGLQNQSGASDATAWLPRFQDSEAPEDGQGVDILPNGRRMSFTYRVAPSAIAPVTRIQTSYLGKKDYQGKYNIELVRSYQQNFPVFTLSGGQTVKQQITIESANDLLVRAFVGNWPVGQVTCIIRDIASGYNLMNVPTMLDNFAYNLAREANFKPRPFSPWIAPRNRTYQIEITNLDPQTEATAYLSFWGTLCNFTITP